MIDALDPQGPAQRPTPDGEVQTLLGRMEVCPPTRLDLGLVGDNDPTPDQAEKLSLVSAPAAPDAGAFRAHLVEFSRVSHVTRPIRTFPVSSGATRHVRRSRTASGSLRRETYDQPAARALSHVLRLIHRSSQRVPGSGRDCPGSGCVQI